MPQDKTIKVVMERFDKLPRTKHAPDFKDSLCLSVPIVRKFIQQEIKLALESKEQEIQKNIEHYFNNIIHLPCPDFTIKNNI